MKGRFRKAILRFQLRRALKTKDLAAVAARYEKYNAEYAKKLREVLGL